MRLAQNCSGVKNLKVEECAYIAGFIDGEGYLGLLTKKENKRQRERMQPMVHISNTNLDVLLWIRDTIGYGSTVNHRLWSNNPTANYKTCYRYVLLNKKQIILLLEQIIKYLIIKRVQAKLLIDFCNRKNRSHLSEKDYKIYYEIKKLNKRGIL